MADQSAIEWTDTTWNPVTGCDRVSPGCAHCYALDLAARLKSMGQAKYQRDGDPKTSGPGFGLTLHEAELERPLRWRKPRRVFVNSMSDLFHEEVPFPFIAEVFDVMASEPCEKHTFQILTKRPERMVEFFQWQAEYWPGDTPLSLSLEIDGHPGRNVWLGVSIENRRFVNRADLLRQTPAAVRFISAEPLLGPLVFGRQPKWRCTKCQHEMFTNFRECPRCGYTVYDPAVGFGKGRWSDGFDGPELDLTDIDWLIVGGESGPGHRRVDPQWVRDLRDDCMFGRTEDEEHFSGPPAGGTAFFFKQWGGAKPTSGGRELDGRTWDEFPEAKA